MSVATLLSVPCELVRRSPSTPDEYGDPTWAETAAETVCELQQESAVEANGQAVEDTTWRLFLPPGAASPEEPRGWDAVRVSGVTYELDGDTWAVRNPRTGGVSHVEARVRRVE